MKRRFRLKLKKDAVFSIAYILLFCLTILVILSFTRQGKFLFDLNVALIDFFGWGVVFVAFFLFLAGLSLTKFKVPWNQASVLAGGGLMAVSLMALTRAGWVGRGIFEEIAYFITPLGAGVILLASATIGFIVFFNTSLDQLFLAIVNFFKPLLEKPKVEKKTPQFIQDKSIVPKAPLPKNPNLVVKEPPKIPVNEEPEELPTATLNVPGAQSEVWNYPPLSLLTDTSPGEADRGDTKANAAIIERTFDSFGISARVVEVNGGPAVTQYAIEVALGTKLSKITALANDLALALAAPTGQIRIEAPIPGRALVGIELPNRSPETVILKRILTSEAMKDRRKKLLVPLGLDVSGEPKVADITKMPHVLIAGQTGSGKSVLLNSWIATLLFRTSPSEVKMILVDPKRVEFTQYGKVPHLLSPVIVEPEKVVHALNWATKEMDERYKKFAEAGARNIESYNEMAGFQAMPYIVIIIDELADIILFAPAEVEDHICRLAQMARATGIHLVIATQRPSVDVLTGLIKANIPTRISFAVASMTDSRVILDSPGAEKLLGRGDMLYIPPDQAKPSRIQGAFVSDREIHKLIEFMDQSGLRPVYTEEVTEATPETEEISGGNNGERDPFFAEAVRVVCQTGRASSSFLQRRFSIGYTRAARILDQLEEAGVVGPAIGSKPRDILIQNAEEFLASH